MKVAYLITAHSHPEQFIRLIRQLDSKESLFFVHIDKKIDITSFKKVEDKVDTSKLIWLKRRSIKWGGFSQDKVTLDVLQCIINHPVSISYISFISGQHYPIKSVEFFHDFLNRNTSIAL